MVRLFTEMVNDGVSPNGLFFLIAITDQVSLHGINFHVEKRLLETAGPSR